MKEIKPETAKKAIHAMAQSQHWNVNKMAEDHDMSPAAFKSQVADMFKPSTQQRRANPDMPHQHMNADEYRAFCNEAELRGVSPGRLWYLRQHGEPEPPIPAYLVAANYQRPAFDPAAGYDPDKA